MIQIGEVLGGLFADLGIDEGMTAEGGQRMEPRPAPGLRAESPMKDRESSVTPPASAPGEEFRGLKLVSSSGERARPQSKARPGLGARSPVLVWDADHALAASP